MVKLDLNLLAYLKSEDFRVLQIVETGMRNHEIVPCKLISSLTDLRSGVGKILRNLCYNRLLTYERGRKFDGYRLTNLGYDYLALRVLRNRNVIDQVGNQIGMGKEALVYIVRNSTKNEQYALKVHRLGRTSFKTVFNKRDYHKSKVGNWLYLSRLAALREYSFMKILYERGFNSPEPLDNNRHCIVMKWIDGILLNNLSKDDEIDYKKLLEKLLNMILDLANNFGVVHGDFNEFNIIIQNQTNEPYLIDFPQMIATDHQQAKEYFERDVQCIISFFKKKFSYLPNEVPTFESVETNETTEHIIKHIDYENEMLNRYLEDNLLLCENFQEKLNIFERNNKNLNDEITNELDMIKEDQEKKFENHFTNQINDSLNLCTEYDSDDSPADDNIKKNKGNYTNQVDGLSTSSYSASKIGGSSIASTFTPDQIHSILKKENERRARKNLVKESFKKIKGDVSSSGRQRKTNKQYIKEDSNIFDWIG